MRKQVLLFLLFIAASVVPCAAQTFGEEEALRNCVRRGTPFGNEGWVKETVDRSGLETTLRPRGRPKKVPEKGS